MSSSQHIVSRISDCVDNVFARNKTDPTVHTINWEAVHEQRVAGIGVFFVTVSTSDNLVAFSVAFLTSRRS